MRALVMTSAVLRRVRNRLRIIIIIIISQAKLESEALLTPRLINIKPINLFSVTISDCLNVVLVWRMCFCRRSLFFVATSITLHYIFSVHLQSRPRTADILTVWQTFCELFSLMDLLFVIQMKRTSFNHMFWISEHMLVSIGISLKPGLQCKNTDWWLACWAINLHLFMA